MNSSRWAWFGKRNRKARLFQQLVRHRRQAKSATIRIGGPSLLYRVSTDRVNFTLLRRHDKIPYGRTVGVNGKWIGLLTVGFVGNGFR